MKRIDSYEHRVTPILGRSGASGVDTVDEKLGSFELALV